MQTLSSLLMAEQALRVDPWFEAAHRLVLSCHHATRNHLAARRALDSYREAIDELGFAPEEATRMVQRLLSTLPPDVPGG